MTTKSKTASRVASVAAPTGLAEELLDQLVAFRPIETTLVETQMGASEATVAQVVTVDADGVPHNRGEIPIFWIVVRDQLRGASSEVPWVAGVLTQAGRAFRLRELSPRDVERVDRAIAALPA